MSDKSLAAYCIALTVLAAVAAPGAAEDVAIAPTPSCVVQLAGDPSGAVIDRILLKSGRMALAASNGIFEIDPLARTVEKLGDAKLPGEHASTPDSYLHELPDGTLVAASLDTLYVAGPTDTKLRAVSSFKGQMTHSAVAGDDFAVISEADVGTFKIDVRTGATTILNSGQDENLQNIGTFVLLEQSAMLVGEQTTIKLPPSPNGFGDQLVVGSSLLVHSADEVMVWTAKAGKFSELSQTLRAPEIILVGDDSDSDVAYIFAKGRLFAWNDTTDHLVDMGSSPPMSNAVHLESGSVIAYSTENGKIEFVVPGRPTAAFPGQPASIAITPVSDHVALITTDSGLFRYSDTDGSIQEITNQDEESSSTEMGTWSAVPIGGDQAFVTFSKEIYLFDASKSPLQRVAKFDRAVVNVPSFDDGTAFVQVDRTLLTYDRASKALVPSGAPELLGVLDSMEMDTGNGIFLTDSGIFLPDFSPLATAKVVAITNPADLRPARGALDASLVTFKTDHPCARSIASELSAKITANGTEVGTKGVIATADADGTTQLSVTLPITAPGAWDFQFLLAGQPFGSPARLMVSGVSLWETIASLWPQAIAAVLALDLLAFIGILIGSRWALGATRLLMDPHWGRLVSWPLFALRQIPGVQSWILAPWFTVERRRLSSEHPFSEVVLHGESGEIPASALLIELGKKNRIWLQGKSGMGKSSISRELERAFYEDQELTTLSASIRRFGFTLISLSARAYADIAAPTPGRPESWVLSAVQRRLAEDDIETDLGLVEAILKSGKYAILVDGINEADRDVELNAFARQFKKVALLVTSQAAPSGGNWKLLHLPSSIADSRSALLSLWLGDEAGKAFGERIDNDGVSQFLTTGYDLRLIVDLAQDDLKGTSLPIGRAALYRAMLTRVEASYGQPLPLEALSEIAWKMVVARRRRMTDEDTKQLGATLIDTLEAAPARILRRARDAYEFRHDQMRAFLAASWLVDELPTNAARQEAVSQSGILRLNRRDQEELFGFFALLLPAPDDVDDMWNYAVADPITRGILMSVLQDEADLRKLVLTRKQQPT